MAKRRTSTLPILLSLLATAAAAPAIVWQRGAPASGDSAHSSAAVAPADLVLGPDSATRISASPSPNGGSSVSVVFVLGRDEHGAEALTPLAAGGSLPKTEARYGDATAILHHVEGMETAKAAAAAMGAGGPVTLEELPGLGLGPGSDEAGPEAAVVVVDVPTGTNPSRLDDAVAAMISSEGISRVVLAAQRSADEVKLERGRLAQAKSGGSAATAATAAPRRRLEDQNGDDDGAYDGDGTAYVNMTPNILAGILYTFLFLVVTQIGIGCMSQIQGQDVYVKKMPTVGREA